MVLGPATNTLTMHHEHSHDLSFTIDITKFLHALQFYKSFYCRHGGYFSKLHKNTLRDYEI
jgi:hypothetical protein